MPKQTSKDGSVEAAMPQRRLTIRRLGAFRSNVESQRSLEAQ